MKKYLFIEAISKIENTSLRGRNDRSNLVLSIKNRDCFTAFAMTRVLLRCLLVFLIGLIGCETEPILFKGPYFVRFTENARIIKESYSPVVEIEVHLAGPEMTEDIAISYTISGNAREGIDYSIVGTRGRVVIKKGEYFSYIKVQLLNNANNILRSQDLVLTLTHTDAGLRVGQSKGGIGKEFKLTINDDCILGGTYSGVQTAFDVPTEGIQLTSTDCENYVLSNWGFAEFNTIFPLALSFIDNGDNTLTIPEQKQPEFNEKLATIKGLGSVNPLTREIFFTISYLVPQTKPKIDTVFVDTQITLTPQ